MPRPPQDLLLAAIAALSAVGTASAAPPTSVPDVRDPMAEVPHAKVWIDVEPAPAPSGPPLMGPDGTDEAGYPRKALDRAALRSLLSKNLLTLRLESGRCR